MVSPTVYRWFLMMLCCAGWTIVQAQSLDDLKSSKPQNKYDYEQILSTDHWNFFIRPSVALTLTYHLHQSGLDFKFPSSHPDLAGGWQYRFHLPRHWGIQTGLSIEQQWYRESWTSQRSFNGQYDDRFSQVFTNITTLSLPVYASYSLPLFDKHNSWLLDFKLGVDVRYTPRWNPSGNSTVQLSTSGTSDYDIRGAQSINPAIHAAIGAQYVLKNKHLLELSMSYTAAPFYRQTEHYIFTSVSRPPVSGSFSRSYSYLGIEINYVFTNVRRMKEPKRGYIADKPAKTAKYYDYEQIFSTNHWNFFVRPAMAISSGYHFQHSGLDLKLRPVGMSVTFGWMYQFNFKKWWGIQTGISIEDRWFSFNYSNPKSYNGIRPDGAPQTLPANGGGLLPSLPVYAVFRYPLYDTHNSCLLNFRLGASVRYIPSSGSEYGSYAGLPGTSANYQFIDLYTSNPDLIDVVLHGSVGLQYILPNKKLLEISLVGSYAPMFRENFAYSFSTGSSQQVVGGFSEHYGYLGIEINYVFTRVRHMKPARPGYTVGPIKKPLRKTRKADWLKI